MSGSSKGNLAFLIFAEAVEYQKPIKSQLKILHGVGSVPGYSAKIAYRYRIDSSLDKTTWEPIADASENREFREVYEHTIPKRLARYIRLTTLPHPDLKDHQARPKIAEILVYGAR